MEIVRARAEFDRMESCEGGEAVAIAVLLLLIVLTVASVVVCCKFCKCCASCPFSCYQEVSTMFCFVDNSVLDNYV